MGKKVKVRGIKSKVKRVEVVSKKKSIEERSGGGIEFSDNVSSERVSAVGAPTLEGVEERVQNVTVPVRQERSKVSGSVEERDVRNQRALYDARGEAAFRAGYSMGGGGSESGKSYKSAEDTVAMGVQKGLRRSGVGDFGMGQRSSLPEGQARDVEERMEKEREEMEGMKGKKYKWQEFE
jgi:hypothetical protein